MALLTDSTVSINENGNEIKWNRYILGNKLPIEFDGAGKTGITLFENIQSFIGGALASRYTDSIPSTQLRLNDKDKVLLSHLHDYSDWVITFDKNLGPQIFDQPSKEDKVPFLLDYIPGEEISGISSYLTTRPTSEILGLLGPHFEEFNLNIFNIKDEKKIKILLEDLRAVSSSLVLQLNSSKNKAFEVIGTAFTKRVLEKKGFLEEAFLIPIDLHQNLFENQSNESKSRADNLLVSMNTNEKEISFTVIEIKCRKSIGEAEKDELKNKMKEQIQNTIETLKIHFDPEYHLSFDRLDREIKNKELKSLLGFYLDRAHRYEYLNPNAFNTYSEFIQKLDEGFKFKFKQLGLIYDFSASKSHHKEVIDSELTFFTFGRNLVEEILNPDSDLNTRRLEEKEFEDELSQAIGIKNVLNPFIQKFKLNENDNGNEDNIETGLPNNSSRISDNIETQQPTEDVVVLDGYIKDESQDDNEEIILGDDSDLSKDEPPQYDILIGKGSSSAQFGILGESIHGKKIAIDLSETNTISLFGVQGGGKSYTIGTITEMVLKQFRNINKLPSPLAGVIFHYSESMDYEPEFTSMIYPNDREDELEKLRVRYGAYPDNIKDVIIINPKR